MAELYSIVYIYHIFFIHSSVDGHLGYLHEECDMFHPMSNSII